MDGGGSNLVGRAAECGQITRGLISPAGGRATALVLRGPPGVGKSALLEWSVAQAGDCTVLRATGTLRDMRAPFSLLEELLRPNRPGGAGQAVRGQPSLVDELGHADGPVDRFKLAMVMFSALSSLAESRRVLVVVDDVQWADHSSLDALLLARMRLEDDDVGMLFAQRDGEPSALDRADLPALYIGGLTPADACELLSGTVDASVALQLVEHTGGIPLALLELAEGLDPDQRAGRAPVLPWLLRTPTVEAGFLRRVESLSPDARRVLDLASVDSAIEPAVLRACSPASAGATDVIGTLVERDFLRLDEHERFLVFTHPLLRMAVYQAMDPQVRRDWHRRVAAILRRDDDVTRRAWHLAGASDGPDDIAARELERAGEYSRQRGAYAVAAETLERSADLTGDAGTRTGRLLAAGDAYWLAGQVERSAQVLDTALAFAPDQAHRADVQLKRITTQRTRSSEDMFDELTREAEATEAADPQRAALLYAQAIMAGMMGMRLERTIRSSDRALELLDPESPMVFVARLLRALVVSLAGRHQDALPVFAGFVEMLDAVGPSPMVAGLLEYTALSLMSGDDVATSSRILDMMVDYARRERAIGLLPLPLSARGEVRWRCGAWAEALADATESLAIVKQTEQFIERSHSLMLQGKIQGGVGRFDEARGLVDEALAVGRQGRSAGLHYMACSAYGFVELSAGEHRAALGYLLECRDYSKRSGDRVPTLWLWRAELVEVAIKLGDTALAREVSAEFDEDAELHGTHHARAFAARCRGLVAVDETAMRAAFAESLEHMESLPFGFEQARTRLLYGEHLFAAGRPRDAAAQLSRALETFDQLGAHPWSDRARVHLAPDEPAFRLTAIDQLTERELQIAVTVSTGKTSAEAARELFLSRRTVEHHLAAVYRKLGIRNRTELASLFRGAPESGAPASSGEARLSLD